MSNGIVAKFDTLRSLDHASISGNYAPLGTPLTYPTNVFRIINNTDGDMFISDNGTLDKLFMPFGSYVIYDVSSNRNDPGNSLKIAAQTQFYVKQSSAATKGAVYLEIIYQN